MWDICNNVKWKRNVENIHNICMELEVSEMQENYGKKAETEKFTEILFSDRSTKNIFCTFP